MPALAMPKDDWTPAKLKQHQEWRRRMYQQRQPAPVVPVAPVIEPAPEPPSIAQRMNELEHIVHTLRTRFAVALAERAIAEEPLGPTPHATIEDILAVIAKFYDFTPLQFKSAAKPSALANARQVAMYVCKECTLRSLKEIGRHFGGRDHSTVCHAHDKVRKRMRADKEFCQEVAELEALFA